MTKPNLGTEKLLAKLPNYFHPDEGFDVPADIIGSRIVSFGTFAEDRLIDGGGLVIEYVPSGSRATKRIVLAFGETGMWIEFPMEEKPPR